MSGNGNWEGVYDFYATHVTFTITRMPADRAYWVLYEGTPGGTLDSRGLLDDLRHQYKE